MYVAEAGRKSTVSTTRMLPSVIVPVLSKHNVSTRASISMQYSSCARVLFLLSRKKDAPNATLVNKKGPAGIMEITDPLVARTVSNSGLFVRSNTLNADQSMPLLVPFTTNKHIVMGTMMIATNTKMRLSDFNIWERGFWYMRARPVSPAM